MAVDFYIKQGDTAPPITATLLDADEAIVPLAGVTVKFLMTNKLTGVRVVSADANVQDALAGKVSYQWQAGDTDVPATYNAEFEVAWPDGTFETFPNLKYITVKIQADLGGAVG